MQCTISKSNVKFMGGVASPFLHHSHLDFQTRQTTEAPGFKLLLEIVTLESLLSYYMYIQVNSYIRSTLLTS